MEGGVTETKRGREREGVCERVREREEINQVGRETVRDGHTMRPRANRLRARRKLKRPP